MIISLDWLKKYVDIDLPTNELVELIGSRLVEVEEVIDLGEKYRGIKIVEVRSVEKIPGSDHLTVCQVDTGVIARSVTTKQSSATGDDPGLFPATLASLARGRNDGGADRDDNLIQVVCGAPNVRTGMLAVWLPPKTVLPATFNSEPLVLDKRKVMGVESAGMLAAMDELDLGADHAGIIEINPEMAKPGDDFAEVFDLNDTLLDIENKSLTHRPDCFGVIGFAREVAGILGKEFQEPDVIARSVTTTTAPAKAGAGQEQSSAADNDTGLLPATLASRARGRNDTIELDVEITDPKLCPRYQALVLDGFDDKPSKYLSEMAVLLAKSGMRSINPIVDVTNYLMLLTGQPLHAFDYDKLIAVGCHPERSEGSKESSRDSSSAAQNDNAHIIVRAAKKNEKLELLDDKTIELDPGDIVITSNNVPVALAGAMGGKNTEIDESTRRIVIESATFSLYNLRGTQFRHGIFSEAITRFTKGQPPALTDPVLCEAIRTLTNDHGMKSVSEIVDAYPKPVKPPVVKVTTEQVNNLLGSGFTFDDIITTLSNVGFKVTLGSGVIASATKQSSAIRNDSGLPRRSAPRNDGGYLKVTAPWWRTDIHIAEDVIEEIGRLNGYDNIPARLPRRDFVSPTPDTLGDLKSKIRQILSEAGANEVLTYSFISEKLLKNVGQDSKNSYKIINSISPELQYIRQMITPSLLEKVSPNIKDKFDEFALFEINQVFDKEFIKFHKDPKDGGVPIVENALGLVLVSDQEGSFYRAKKYAEDLFKALGVDVVFKSVEVQNSWTVPFELKRTADIRDAKTDKILGIVGNYRTTVRRSFKLPDEVAGFEININNLMAAVSGVNDVSKRSDFPEVERDITFRVYSDLEYAKLENLLCKTLTEQNLWFQCVPVSIWQGEDKKTKNISFKLTFASYEKTLNSKEIAGIIDGIADLAKKELRAKVI
ncbi:phenylalanine--tRNA ligase subunit beta [Candidatus Saccharibacteria bacterium]|nr:phenylalanine--tRNA ligase subunit beta [Candidatus Saccharibacteria bacterium]